MRVLRVLRLLLGASKQPANRAVDGRLGVEVELVVRRLPRDVGERAVDRLLELEGLVKARVQLRLVQLRGRRSISQSAQSSPLEGQYVASNCGCIIPYDTQLHVNPSYAAVLVVPRVMLSLPAAPPTLMNG